MEARPKMPALPAAARRTPAESLEPFELCVLGGSIERRYRRMRPEVNGMPWGTLDPRRYSSELVLLARRSWTEAAFQEHRTAAACAAALQALITARAPVDLVAVAARFPLDELVHVELCARLAMELGGGAPILHDPSSLISTPAPGQSALMAAAELMVRFFCVGEAISVPLLRGTWRAATHPLVKAVLGRIVKDEAAHGELGFWFLDWADPFLGPSDRVRLAEVAGATIAQLQEGWRRTDLRPRSGRSAAEIHALGWMSSEDYLPTAAKALAETVQAPLRARGIDVSP
jgi:hypothetical protein